MIVANLMQTNVATIRKNETLARAGKTMRQHKIDHLLVVEEEELVGIVSDEDLRGALASQSTTLDIYEIAYILDETIIESIMSKNLITVSPSLPIEQAAKILHDKKFGCLPVLENGKLVGIITMEEVLHFLMDAMNVGASCLRVELEVPNEPGMLIKVLDCLGNLQYNINSVITSPERSGEYKVIVLNIGSNDLKGVTQALEQGEYKILNIQKQEEA